MPYTAQNLINDMLGDLGVIFAGDTPNGSESNACLRRLNDLQFSLDTQRLSINYIVPANFLVASGLTFGDTGAGGTQHPRPIAIKSLKYAIGVGFNQTSFPVRQVGVEEFRVRSANLAIARIPEIAYYNSGYPVAQLLLYPDPISFAAADTGQIIMDYWQKSSTTAGVDPYALGTTMDLPPGYLRMLRTLLAAECAPLYERVLAGSTLERIAFEAKAVIRALNAPPYIGGAEEAQAAGTASPVPPDAANSISR